VEVANKQLDNDRVSAQVNYATDYGSVWECALWHTCTSDDQETFQQYAHVFGWACNPRPLSNSVCPWNQSKAIDDAVTEPESSAPKHQ
jgi:hypothetical protein